MIKLEFENFEWSYIIEKECIPNLIVEFNEKYYLFYIVSKNRYIQEIETEIMENNFSFIGKENILVLKNVNCNLLVDIMNRIIPESISNQKSIDDYNTNNMYSKYNFPKIVVKLQ